VARHCLRVLSGAHRRGGRPPLDDSAAMVTLNRLWPSRDAVSVAARLATGSPATAQPPTEAKNTYEMR
jgi:hypothetical protein